MATYDTGYWTSDRESKIDSMEAVYGVFSGRAISSNILNTRLSNWVSVA